MKIVILNGGKINYDGLIDYAILGDDVVIYDDSKPEEITKRVEGCEVVVTKELVLTSEQILNFPDCVKLICEAGTGYNNIPLNACKQKGITVTNIPAYSSKKVAQTAIMMILMLASEMQKQITMLAHDNYTNFDEHLIVKHGEVNDKTLGVIGAGNIGQEVIKIAKALGMNILVYSRTPKKDEENVTYTSFDEVISKADYVTLHCPLNEQTKHLINKNVLNKMKKSACIINTARGALIDEKALIEALKNKTIFAAGLDVQENEPLDPTSELFKLDNVILTPHIGWKAKESRQRLLSILKDNIDAYKNGKPINVVI